MKRTLNRLRRLFGRNYLPQRFGRYVVFPTREFHRPVTAIYEPAPENRATIFMLGLVGISRYTGPDWRWHASRGRTVMRMLVLAQLRHKQIKDRWDKLEWDST